MEGKFCKRVAADSVADRGVQGLEFGAGRDRHFHGFSNRTKFQGDVERQRRANIYYLIDKLGNTKPGLTDGNVVGAGDNVREEISSGVIRCGRSSNVRRSVRQRDGSADNGTAGRVRNRSGYSSRA